jgi:hypothetical protein
MQSTARPGHVIEKGRKGPGDAMFVDLAHVMVADAAVFQRLAFGAIHRAQAQNANIFLWHWRCDLGETGKA